jgi:hypothetical protein
VIDGRAARERCGRTGKTARACVWAVENGDGEPEDLVAWALERAGLEREPLPGIAGADPIWLAAYRARTNREPIDLADAALLATDLFPLAERWRRVERDVALAAMAYDLAHDLVYDQTERMDPDVARAHVRALAGGYDPAAIFLVNLHEPHTWTPVTTCSIDRAYAIVDGARVAILTLGGED